MKHHVNVGSPLSTEPMINLDQHHPEWERDDDEDDVNDISVSE